MSGKTGCRLKDALPTFITSDFGLSQASRFTPNCFWQNILQLGIHSCCPVGMVQALVVGRNQLKTIFLVVLCIEHVR